MFVEGEAVHSDEWFHLSQQESSATACRIMKEPFGVSKNGFELSIDDTDAFDGGSSILVRASGAAAAVVEMAQQASWLGKLLACEEFVLFDFRGHPVKIEESLYATYTVCVSELDIWLVLELSDSRTFVLSSAASPSSFDAVSVLSMNAKLLQQVRAAVLGGQTRRENDLS